MAISIQQLYKSIREPFFNCIPNKKGIENTANFEKWGNIISSPHWNRLIMGGTAIALQPEIDYFNPNVDEETAKTSMLRTIAKIIAGTAVGFIVRGACYKSTNFLVKNFKSFQFSGFRPDLGDVEKKYISGISTLVALLAMFYTNFKFDIPLTNAISKYLITRNKANKSVDSNNINPTQISGERNSSQSAADRIKDAFQSFESGRKAGA